ncbi:acyltransferase family protein [Streptomyces sp. NPDC002742]|uniref:acyltransferase family protein n=1 Tax=Streptomyces sp. NPDC002742 TaxID=3364663 RepID=UPI0036AF79C9
MTWGAEQPGQRVYDDGHDPGYGYGYGPAYGYGQQPGQPVPYGPPYEQQMPYGQQPEQPVPYGQQSEQPVPYRQPVLHQEPVLRQEESVRYAEPVPYEEQWRYGPGNPAGDCPESLPANLPEDSPEEPSEESPSKVRAGGRDRYFDALRAVALVRVVTYHTFGWAWAGLVFPSMGVMFALAGTLMARSLERPALKVVRSRMRRLLPPFWFWGLFVVMAMMIHGWMPGWQIVFWIVPVGDPPGNQWGVQAWEILWYLRTYLWFVLLSPLLLKIFRKAPIPVLLLSLVPVVVFQYGWQPPDGRPGSALTDLATYLFCWLVGFAHREGVLQRLKPAAVVLASLGALAYGAWYALAHQAEFGTYDLDEVPLAQAFWSAGFVTPLMYFKAYYDVDFAWLARFRRLDRTVTIFNGRAVTIYLWHEIALILAVPLIDQFWKVPAFEKWLPLESQWFMFAIGWALIWTAIPLFGWVEDVAARKKPRLLP